MKTSMLEFDKLVSEFNDNSEFREIVKNAKEVTEIRMYIDSIDPIINGKCYFNYHRDELFDFLHTFSKHYRDTL